MRVHRLRLAAAAAGVFLGATGCMTMDMSIAPDIGKPERLADAPPKMAGTVGYFISTQDRSGVVRSANGRVAYHPYRDLEPGMRQMLGNLFEGVVRLDSLTDLDMIRGAGVRFIVEPRLSTSIGAPSQLLPPSSSFEVELTTTVRCPFSDVVASAQVLGRAKTQDAETIVDERAPGRRAMEDALAQMQAALSSARLDDTNRIRCPAIP